MRRREFIAGLGGAATWPLAACGQKPGIPIIGFLSIGAFRPFAHVAPVLNHQHLIPAGSIGIWRMADYSASPNPVVANSATATAVSGNLFRLSRRNFAGWWANSSCTIADSAATAPDGSNDASTVVGTGNWLVSCSSASALVAGTYTVGINVKRNTGSNQRFAFTKDNTSNRSAAQTATSSWQRFTFTFTFVSSTTINRIAICSIDGTTGANLQICDFELYSGSSDLGPAVPAGHLYLGGLSSADTLPTTGTGFLNFSNGSGGSIQFASSTSFSRVTASAVVKKLAASSTGFHAFLSGAGNGGADFHQFTAFTEQSASQRAYFGGATAGPGYSGWGGGLWNPLNQGWHVMSMRYDGTNLEMWLDDFVVVSVPQSISPVSVCDFFVSFVNSLGLSSKYGITQINLWNRALSPSEMKAAYLALRQESGSAGVALNDARVLNTEGDSITELASGIGSYAYQYNAQPGSPPTLGSNFAVSGSAIKDLNTRAAAVDATLPTSKGNRKFILSVMIGANDLSSLGSSRWLTNYAAYCDARRAAGWYLVVCTLLPIKPALQASYNTLRAVVNPVIRSWVGVHADAICDFAANPDMGNDSDALDVSKFVDGEHPTTAGHTFLLSTYAPVINAI